MTPPHDEVMLYEDAQREAEFRASLRRSRARRALATRLRDRRRRARGSGGALTTALVAVVLLAPLAAAQDASPTALLQPGSRGTGVTAIQRELGVAATGRYDAATRAAVRAFQRRSGLDVDGIVGPQTRRALAGSTASAPATATAASSAVGGATAGPVATTAATTSAPGTGSAGATLARIAQCESGGNPAAVSSGGTYRGKYQFTRATWKQLGGTGDPAAAPEAVQDRLAAQLLAERGTAPWPVCG